ncbi:hypothetical protein [Coleofasciculus sp. H7-2]|uniref:hypothetical protein n=1 Tax=Coleofasciculus sp. H7-2 TaxID=3351545 RepID=UPI00366F31B5
MASYRSAIWVNSLSFLVVISLIVYTKLFGASAGILFEPPLAPPDPNAGLLTHTFQLLCAVPPIVCTFSFALLRTIQPQQKGNLFILYSAIITGGFLVNEIFRIHIILLRAGIPKLITIVVYAMTTLGYGLAFRRKIKSTPYILLLSGIGLLFSAIAVDSLKLSGDGVSVLLEGVPKLFSEINIALYFWSVCYGEILRSRNSSPHD